ncbi:MAG TPA: hypothetical protein VGR78_05840, partial [Verrucomicrobiae bacterium]|nr:hypothetical protein [Verrucomicrobiae bacterium]
MSSMASLTPPVSSPAPQPSADDSANSSPLCRAPGKKANFDQLLDSHLDSKDEQKDVSPAKKRADEKPADPWSLLGVVPGVPPVIPQPPVEQNSDLAGSGKSAAELKTEPGAIPPA